jgi:hypothetical protein
MTPQLRGSDLACYVPVVDPAFCRLDNDKKKEAAMRFGALFLSACVLLAGPAQAQGDLRAAAQNPISSLISLPFKFTFDNGAPGGDANAMSIQPVYPVTVGDWNLVNRLIVPVINAPGGVAGLPFNPGIGELGDGGRAFGLGDINYSLFLNPVNSSGNWIWGVGGSITFPTATSDELGSGKWSVGPTAVALAQPGWGSYGMLVRQLWSVAGESDRQDVNNALVETFVNYNLDNGWYLLTDSAATINWNADEDKLTLPLGGGVGKFFQIGGQPLNARVEGYYNALRPDNAPEWEIGATIQFLFPK